VRARSRYPDRVKKTNPVMGLYTYAEFGACMIALLPVMAVSYYRHRDDPTQRHPGRWMRRLGKAATTLSPLWKMNVEGEPPADIGHKGYVVVANHESQADPFLLSWLPFDMRWVAKEELFKPPLTGWIMRYSGDIPLRRGEGGSVRAMMKECERALAGGISIMMFPEGTRSKDGNMLPFKDGPFALALRAGVPVLPVAIAGTRAMRPKHSKWFGEARACAKVLPAIPTTGMTEADVARLREQSRDAIGAALPELRSRYGTALT
jgi:1-acyl-sn-glycerol-3-phosphate acyltransferase